MLGRVMNAVRAVRVDLHRAVVDSRQPRLDQLPIRHDIVLVVIESPDVAERAEGDVELAARQRARLAGLAQHGEGVLADGHRRDAGVLVHPDHVAAVFPDAEQVLEAIELPEHLLERFDGLRLIAGPRGQRQLRPHRHARAFDPPRRVILSGATGSKRCED